MEAVHLLYNNQYNFLKHDLESVNRNKTPFVVVQGHRPMYTTSNETREAPLRLGTFVCEKQGHPCFVGSTIDMRGFVQ